LAPNWGVQIVNDQPEVYPEKRKWEFENIKEGKRARETRQGEELRKMLGKRPEKPSATPAAS
jgi:hypothetical protein